MPGDGLELEWEDDSDQSCSGLFAGEQVPMASQDRHTLMKGELGSPPACSPRQCMQGASLASLS